jgi:hypothetical protein
MFHVKHSEEGALARDTNWSRIVGWSSRFLDQYLECRSVAPPAQRPESQLSQSFWSPPGSSGILRRLRDDEISAYFEESRRAFRRYRRPSERTSSHEVKRSFHICASGRRFGAFGHYLDPSGCIGPGEHFA